MSISTRIEASTRYTFIIYVRIERVRTPKAGANGNVKSGFNAIPTDKRLKTEKAKVVAQSTYESGLFDTIIYIFDTIAPYYLL